MAKTIDVYGSELVEDYAKIVLDFGLEEFDPSMFPEPNRIMRRGEVFAGRDLKIIADCIKNKKPFYVLSGIMPTGDRLHFGSKLVVEQIRYFQEHGAKAYILVADLEAMASRGVTLEQARQRALDFHIPAYIALGLDPKKTIFYFQSQNMDVVHQLQLQQQNIVRCVINILNSTNCICNSYGIIIIDCLSNSIKYNY